MPINAEGASRNLQIRIEKGNRRAKEKGTQFTCFTSKKVGILTPGERRARAKCLKRKRGGEGG